VHHQHRGKFITFEGIEGAGKSTQLRAAEQYLRMLGKRVLMTREPGGTPLGEEIRQILLSHSHGDMACSTELLLMFASRAQHLERKILPALETGTWVLCDRFTDATYAYQGGGRGIAWERIRLLEDWVQGTLRPDLTLLFDLPVAVGQDRAGKRSAPDRFERESPDFFEAIRGAYLRIASREPGRVKIIDATGGLSQTSDAVQHALGVLIGGNHGGA